MQRFSAIQAPGRLSALLLVVVGLGLILLSLFADALDIGGGVGFGYQQLIGVIVGLAFILGAVALVSRPAAAPSTEEPNDLDS